MTGPEQVGAAVVGRCVSATHRHGRRGRVGGFTLMELVVTLGLLALLATLATPLAELEVQREREARLRVALHEMRDAIDNYKRAADKGFIQRKVGDSGYPPSLRILVDGVPNQKSPTSEKFYFLRRLPRDPFAPLDLAADDSWDLRSYSSAADSPSPGDDVYDVHSRSNGIGLNGQPYQRW